MTINWHSKYPQNEFDFTVQISHFSAHVKYENFFALLKPKVVAKVNNYDYGCYSCVCCFPPSLSHLKEEIASQTKIPAANQNLFYSTENLEEMVGPTRPISSYPETSFDSPVILLSQHQGTESELRGDTIVISEWQQIDRTGGREGGGGGGRLWK